MTLTIPRETLRELTVLRNRVEELEYELSQIRGKRESEFDIKVRRLKENDRRLALSMCRILVALSGGWTVTRETLLPLCSTNPIDGDTTLVNCQIKRLRKLAPEYKIITHYGLGYQLEQESLRRVRELMGVTA